ncbi:uncharacterized protein MYCFIDRAFT_180465 [Pseudocercospora fijiensis CIRAD86]|uniref:Uncharacterized protein n=1 Tax=Pseudocercospora fijiensis (strain CIRAD86) TaxID=383855 RepID=M2ZCY7_PSEFD|nr:uncharacterized protein MYCFIDRAFT_180465 [Pseudocercospora fijiensis CIRAD86]EME76979.1 hypothetical protein MYCFIDRAFT_180465 [Pseudocercospora fijiensis CIRAD86]
MKDRECGWFGQRLHTRSTCAQTARLLCIHSTASDIHIIGSPRYGGGVDNSGALSQNMSLSTTLILLKIVSFLAALALLRRSGRCQSRNEQASRRESQPQNSTSTLTRTRCLSDQASSGSPVATSSVRPKLLQHDPRSRLIKPVLTRISRANVHSRPRLSTQSCSNWRTSEGVVFDSKGPRYVTIRFDFTINTAGSPSICPLHIGSIVGGVTLIMIVNQYMNTAKRGILSPTSTCHISDARRWSWESRRCRCFPCEAVRNGDPDSTAVNREVAATSVSKSRFVRLVVMAKSPGWELPIPAEMVDRNAHGEAALKNADTRTQSAIVTLTNHLSSGVSRVLRQEWDVRVHANTAPWPKESVMARASVSSFGYGGTNGHVVIEAVVPMFPGHHHARTKVACSLGENASPEKSDLLCFSTNDKTSLQEHATCDDLALRQSILDHAKPRKSHAATATLECWEQIYQTRVGDPDRSIIALSTEASSGTVRVPTVSPYAQMPRVIDRKPFRLVSALEEEAFSLSSGRRHSAATHPNRAGRSPRVLEYPRSGESEKNVLGPLCTGAVYATWLVSAPESPGQARRRANGGFGLFRAGRQLTEKRHSRQLHYRDLGVGEGVEQQTHLLQNSQDPKSMPSDTCADRGSFWVRRIEHTLLRNEVEAWRSDGCTMISLVDGDCVEWDCAIQVLESLASIVPLRLYHTRLFLRHFDITSQPAPCLWLLSEAPARMGIIQYVIVDLPPERWNCGKSWVSNIMAGEEACTAWRVGGVGAGQSLESVGNSTHMTGLTRKHPVSLIRSLRLTSMKTRKIHPYSARRCELVLRQRIHSTFLSLLKSQKDRLSKSSRKPKACALEYLKSEYGHVFLLKSSSLYPPITAFLSALLSISGESRDRIHSTTPDACFRLIIISMHMGKHHEMPCGTVLSQGPILRLVAAILRPRLHAADGGSLRGVRRVSAVANMFAATISWKPLISGLELGTIQNPSTLSAGWLLGTPEQYQWQKAGFAMALPLLAPNRSESPPHALCDFTILSASLNKCQSGVPMRTEALSVFTPGPGTDQYVMIDGGDAKLLSEDDSTLRRKHGLIAAGVMQGRVLASQRVHTPPVYPDHDLNADNCPEDGHCFSPHVEITGISALSKIIDSELAVVGEPQEASLHLIDSIGLRPGQVLMETGLSIPWQFYITYPRMDQQWSGHGISIISDESSFLARDEFLRPLILLSHEKFLTSTWTYCHFTRSYILLGSCYATQVVRPVESAMFHHNTRRFSDSFVPPLGCLEDCLRWIKSCYLMALFRSRREGSGPGGKCFKFISTRRENDLISCFNCSGFCCSSARSLRRFTSCHLSVVAVRIQVDTTSSRASRRPCSCKYCVKVNIAAETETETQTPPRFLHFPHFASPQSPSFRGCSARRDSNHLKKFQHSLESDIRAWRDQTSDLRGLYQDYTDSPIHHPKRGRKRVLSEMSGNSRRLDDQTHSEDATPRAVPHPLSSVPFLPAAAQPASTSSSPRSSRSHSSIVSGSTASGSKRKRGGSPSKAMEERQYASYPVTRSPVQPLGQVNAGIRDVIQAVRRIGTKRGVLSSRYALPEWKTRVGEGDDAVDDDIFLGGEWRDRLGTSPGLEAMETLVHQANRNSRLGASEAAWNVSVHGILLKKAQKRSAWRERLRWETM